MLGVSHAVEVSVYWWWCKIPYSSCIVNTGSCGCLYHIYSWFLPMSWVLDLSILLRIFVCICMFGWLCRATCSFVSTSKFGVSHAIQNEKKLWNLHTSKYKVGEVLVLGLLLVVVYKIPYSSCMWTRQDVIGVFPSYYCLSVQRVCMS